MALAFRNINVSAADPVEDWGFEGVLAAIDRGNLADWRRIVDAVRNDPWGPVSEHVARATALAEDTGAAAALAEAVERVREQRQNEERRQVAETLRALLTESRLSQEEFARRLGTSRPRFNTYLNGRVTPSAALMVRARAITDRSHKESRLRL